MPTDRDPAGQPELTGVAAEIDALEAEVQRLRELLGDAVAVRNQRIIRRYFLDGYSIAALAAGPHMHRSTVNGAISGESNRRRTAGLPKRGPVPGMME